MLWFACTTDKFSFFAKIWGAKLTNNINLDSSVWIDDVPESMLIDLINEVTKNNPNIKIYSLPKLGPKIKVELGGKGNILDVKKAMEEIKKGLSTLSHKWYEN